MKAIVMAYGNMGCAGLTALLSHGYEVYAVFTHVDDPNEHIWFDSVAELAAQHDIPVFAPENINHPIWVNSIRAMEPDILFSFYYRKMLGKQVLSAASKGGINLHGSLLPAYRGRAPINWVLVNDEIQTGVTLHQEASGDREILHEVPECLPPLVLATRRRCTFPYMVNAKFASAIHRCKEPCGAYGEDRVMSIKNPNRWRPSPALRTVRRSLRISCAGIDLVPGGTLATVACPRHRRVAVRHVGTVEHARGNDKRSVILYSRCSTRTATMNATAKATWAVSIFRIA